MTLSFPCRRRHVLAALLVSALGLSAATSGGCKGKSQAGKAAPVKKGPPAYTAEEISLFMELAFGPEKGGAAGLRRFEGPVRLSTSGKPPPKDLEILGEAVGELNQLLGGEKLVLTGDNPNLILRIVPRAEFAQHVPTPPPAVDPGVTESFEIAPTGVISRGQILLDGAGTDTWRRRFIRSQLVRSLGLLHRTKRDPQSLFADPPGTGFGTLHPPDARLIKMLFDPGLKAGMSRADTEKALKDARAPE